MVEITAFKLENKSCKGFFFWKINFPPMRALEFITGRVTYTQLILTSSNWKPPDTLFLIQMSSVLTIARVLDRIPIIVINDITTITLFSNYSFGCAVASASFVIALFGLVVTLTCCKNRKKIVKLKHSILNPKSTNFEEVFVNLCNSKRNCMYIIK